MKKAGFLKLWPALVGIAVISFLAKVTDYVLWSHKSNEQYLDEIINNHTEEKLSSMLVEQWRQSASDADAISPEEWRRIEVGLSACIQQRIKEYKTSGDQYLKMRLDSNTPMVLADRFLRECGVNND